MSSRRVYHFGNGHADGSMADRALLGGKGANLAELTRIGAPVPPGFTVTTDVCRTVLRRGRYPAGLRDEVAESLRTMEDAAGKRFGDAGGSPLLVSVRSGAAVSMPGMMDTILNIGLNDDTVEALARASGDRRFAFDSYRRLAQMYGAVVLSIRPRRFEALLERRRAERGVAHEGDLGADDLAVLVGEFKALIEEEATAPFPSDPEAQLWGAIDAVFRSWNNRRAIAYRREHGIPDDLGTAVNVVAMVYGNMGAQSGTGVAFTRNPATGEPGAFGEFLSNAQGEDVVAGIRDPVSIDEMKELLPDVHRELIDVMALLERHYRDVQDLEFTVERGRLHLLQTRSAKRTATAAVRIAVDLADEGLLDESEAVIRIRPRQLDKLLHPRIDPAADKDVVATGLPASPGAASGRVVFTADEAAAQSAAGAAVVLVRPETSPDDFHGMVAARAILTARGGMTSHAAVVARGMGTCCVVGARELAVDADARRLAVGDRTIEAGDWLTLDGGTGEVLAGRVPTVDPEPSEPFQRLMAWADARRTVKVRANADTPDDARRARELGAKGIGLCRTEHMFFEHGRLNALRSLILAEDDESRQRALDRLVRMQQHDFEAIFRAMDGLPVTIRLLDPPLHEFLPRGREEIREAAEAAGVAPERLERLVELQRESNPMLGHRGVRLGVSYPAITEMQVRAAFEAAAAAAARGVAVRPEIMVPLVADMRELRKQKNLIRRTAEQVLRRAGVTVPYLIGTMIELPRAALTAGAIAEQAEFFSFGTNDLTQTTFGLSRDDSVTFLPTYIERKVLPDDPFRTLDVEGVGRLVELASREGRTARPDLKLGICGEHGGEPDSIAFFHEVGLDYVSCSPFRVPVARLAAAQAAIRAARPTPSRSSRNDPHRRGRPDPSTPAIARAQPAD